MKRILIKEEYCMGCRLCEIHCLVQHSKSKDIIKVYKGTVVWQIFELLVNSSSNFHEESL
jgi:Fe-S-cluster-containing hydrogenase component 2